MIMRLGSSNKHGEVRPAQGEVRDSDSWSCLLGWQLWSQAHADWDILGLEAVPEPLRHLGGSLQMRAHAPAGGLPTTSCQPCLGHCKHVLQGPVCTTVLKLVASRSGQLLVWF